MLFVKIVALRTMNYGLICHGLIFRFFIKIKPIVWLTIVECCVCYCMACWYGIKTNDIWLLQNHAFKAQITVQGK